ncbi:MAG: sialate O-acetylesterase [Verrucomicrobiota bacterium]
MGRADALRFRRRWFPDKAEGEWAVPDHPRDFDLFLLMGQSNMVGFGCISPSESWQDGDHDPAPGVLVLGGQSKVKSSRPRGRIVWRPAAHPLHLNQRSAGFGMGLPFAAKLREANLRKMIGLIPCAWGGARIDQLGPGSPLYANTVKRARFAAEQGCLRAVLWHQGESDALTEDLSQAHAGKLSRLMETLRADLGESDLPFLIGDLADFTERERWKSDPVAAERNARVRAGLRDLAQRDPHTVFVESEGVEGVDPVHFSREALISFGERYAAAWESFCRV